MIVFCLNIGIEVYIVPEIDQGIAYKYTYPTKESSEQVFPALKVIKVIAIMAMTLFVLNHAVLHLMGCSYRIVSTDGYCFLMTATMAGLSTALLVQSLKLYVRRPRPDFFARCYPNGYPAVWERNPHCTRPLSDPIVNDGWQSFPSGHSASAWSASVFCFLYLREHYKAHSRHTPSRVPRCIPFLVSFALVIFACYVSCSRLWDYQHHPEDIISGGLIGSCLTYFSFFLYYPPLISPTNSKQPHDSSDTEDQSLLHGEMNQV